MKKTLLLLAMFAFSTQASASSILITQFGFDFGSASYAQMANNLAAGGHHTVSVVDVSTAGSLATTLGSGSFDQVFLFDLANELYLNPADIAALSSFWNNRGLVVDTRAYGHHIQGEDPSEAALIQNVASSLESAGGGVWVGTDNSPERAQNANQFLDAIGVNPVTGDFTDPVNFADPSSVLLSGVTPTDLWGDGESVGQAPVGEQPNGVEMFPHFGHADDDSVLPYISANFPLSGVPDSNPQQDPVPQPVPVPTTLVLFGLGLISLAGLHRRNRRRS